MLCLGITVLIIAIVQWSSTLDDVLKQSNTDDRNDDE